jgi:hypothetical protein
MSKVLQAHVALNSLDELVSCRWLFRSIEVASLTIYELNKGIELPLFGKGQHGGGKVLVIEPI